MPVFCSHLVPTQCMFCESRPCSYLHQDGAGHRKWTDCRVLCSPCYKGRHFLADWQVLWLEAEHQKHGGTESAACPRVLRQCRHRPALGRLGLLGRWGRAASTSLRATRAPGRHAPGQGAVWAASVFIHHLPVQLRKLPAASAPAERSSFLPAILVLFAGSCLRESWHSPSKRHCIVFCLKNWDLLPSEGR